MTSKSDVIELRQRLQQLAASVDPAFLRRYAFRYPPPERRDLYRRARMFVGRILRDTGLRAAPPLEPWLPELKHSQQSDEAMPLVIWAIGAEHEALRAACHRLESLQGTLPGWVPVLVTDVADFAFFSRLGWLVEYVPRLRSPAEKYAERKRQYLAWRYRDARAVPLSALKADIPVEEWLLD